MVVGVFPAAKLGMLFIRQISKPLAQMFVNQAKNHPVFRTYFIIPPAQFYHWMEVKAKMYVMNLGAPTKVAKLNEAMAIELGANLMGEVIIFSVAGGCIMLEYARQSAKEAKKEEDRLAQIQQFSDDIEKLFSVTQQQHIVIEQLETLVGQMAKHSKLPANVMLEFQSTNVREKISNRRSEGNGTNVSDNVSDNGKRNQSLLHHAIGFIENDVRRDKHS